jgi:hypothetical protein
MWAYGRGQQNSNDFFKANLEFPHEINIKLGEGISTKRAIEQSKINEEKYNS